jgi:hypothetical protein
MRPSTPIGCADWPGRNFVREDELLDRGLVLTLAANTELVVPLGPDADIHEAAEGPSGAIWCDGQASRRAG